MKGSFFRKAICLFPFFFLLIFSSSAQDTDFIPLIDSDDAYYDESYDAFDTYDYDSIESPSTGESLGEYKGAPDHYVFDNVKLLTNPELTSLEDMARKIGEEHHFGTHIIIIKDYTTFGSTIEDAAEELYSKLNLGYGDQNSGISLVLSMEDRSFDLDAFGYGNDAFTDYGKEMLADSFLDDFKDNDWYKGFADYIRTVEAYLKAAESGSPVDYYPSEQRADSMSILSENLYGFIGLVVIIAMVLAFINLSREKRRMKPVAQATQANAYIAGEVMLSNKQDNFTHKTTRTVRVETGSHRSSGGGGGTTIRPSGHSHHSGHF